MKKIIVASLFAGIGGIALAGQPESDLSPQTETKSFEKKTTFFGPLRLNTTWAETGVAATGIASSDFLHNNLNKPGTTVLFDAPSTPAAPEPVVAPEPIAAEPEMSPAVAEAPAPTSAPSPPTAATSSSSSRKKSPSSSSSSSSSSRSRSRSSGSSSKPAPSSAPRPARSSYSSSGKSLVTDSGKDIVVNDLVVDPPPLFELSVDGGYQSRYYHLGINRVLNGGFIAPGIDGLEGRTTQPEDTDVFYSGISAHWNGFGLGVKYVRGTTDVETRFSQFDRPVTTEYEELVADISYTLAVLPDGWMNVTGGYRAIFFDEETFYNTDRFDDFYVTVGNSVIPYLRPSATYHYLDQGSTLGVNDNTFAPGAKIHDGQLLVIQLDGQLDLPKATGLPFDVVYYAQVGFDDEFNIETNDWDHNWTQVGVTLPIFCGPLTISPNWNYNESAEKGGIGDEEHFWGVNVRFDF